MKQILGEQSREKIEYWVDTFRDKRFNGKIDMIYPQPEIKDNIVYYLAIVKIDPKDTVFAARNDNSCENYR